jgi:hypothetical protein
VADSTWSSQSSAIEPYETPENIRSDLATQQKGIPRKRPLPRYRSARGHRDKTRSLHHALPHRLRPSFQRIVASILEYSGSNALASVILSAEFLPGLHPANNLLNLSTTEPTL